MGTADPSTSKRAASAWSHSCLALAALGSLWVQGSGVEPNALSQVYLLVLRSQVQNLNKDIRAVVYTHRLPDLPAVLRCQLVSPCLWNSVSEVKDQRGAWNCFWDRPWISYVAKEMTLNFSSSHLHLSVLGSQVYAIVPLWWLVHIQTLYQFYRCV